MFDPLKVLVETDLHPLDFPDFLLGLLLLKRITFVKYCIDFFFR